jgi:hypothetical protein
LIYIFDVTHINKAKMNFKLKHLALATVIAASVICSGCSTMTSAYDSTVDTVSGWFKSEPKK